MKQKDNKIFGQFLPQISTDQSKLFKICNARYVIFLRVYLGRSLKLVVENDQIIIIRIFFFQIENDENYLRDLPQMSEE